MSHYNRLPSLLLLIVISFGAHAQEAYIKAKGINYHVFTKALDTREPGTAVVIFENGMGMGFDNWMGVIDQLPKDVPVFTYDRAGVGKSEKTFQMPTIKLVSENLKAILQQLKIEPPYILVGHSLGGLYIRAFAGFYPNDVAGLIFVDPADFTETKEDWNNIFRAIGVPEKRVQEMMVDRYNRSTAIDSVRFGPWSEGQVLTQMRKNDFAEISSLPVPNVPIYFFVGGRLGVPPERRSKEYDHEKFFHKKNIMNMERWNAFIHSSSKGGSLIYMANSGHYIHHDEPHAFLEHLKLILSSISRK